MPRGRPGGTVTLLCTGVDAATRPWGEGATDTATVLRIHDTIVRGTIERHGGYVFGFGENSFSAAFSSATDAVAAAVEAQEQLRDDASIDIPVRMSLHTGDLAASVGRPIEFAAEMIPTISVVVEATCTDAARDHGLIQPVTVAPDDASETEHLMTLAGRAIPR